MSNASLLDVLIDYIQNNVVQFQADKIDSKVIISSKDYRLRLSISSVECQIFENRKKLYTFNETNCFPVEKIDKLK